MKVPEVLNLTASLNVTVKSVVVATPVALSAGIKGVAPKEGAVASVTDEAVTDSHVAPTLSASKVRVGALEAVP
ncbi:hypothetical protein GCM10023183_36140 [Nibribacter koreensis]|uniref:Uncharacterized protein n=1 Tax=Nibribacter koreensis TaxID=1084519 RepID=A0ABP8G1P9_9BACT